MLQFQSNDPRAVRTRDAMQLAFKELLREKPFQKISVTEISERAGFARHTFYNHYETKEDILNHLVDGMLDRFFSDLDNWNFYHAKPGEDIQMVSSFFQAWRDNVELVDLLKKVDIDVVLIGRLKNQFTKFYYEQVTPGIPEAGAALGQYMISFNAYTLLGVLQPWLQDNMKYSPQIMGELVIQLSSAAQRKQTVENFKHIIR
ncbi:MAG: TetR/AcrR family transcriptional regulator [Chloroflexota bacterium]